MRRIVFLIALLALTVCPAGASKPVPNFPYVASGPDGVFYARCVPAEEAGSKGETRIYRVGRDRDELVDRYDWYAKNGVVLAWSPIVGKIAVMAMTGDAAVTADQRVELSFYLGGKLLRAYTTQDLKAWGADVMLRGGGGATFKVIGQEQIPGTNEYVFSIEIKGKKLSFDILTGQPYARSEAAGPEPAPTR